jgi:glutamate carboxypeptidase
MSEPDSTALLEGIRSWVAIETPTGAVERIARLVAMVEAEAQAAGLATERIAGLGGKGEVLLARAEGRSAGPGILVLAHLDTVHPVGTLEKVNSWRVEGERAYGPGGYDMKAGAYMALAAWRLLRARGGRPVLPLTIVWVTDEEIGTPAGRPVIERLAKDSRYALVVEPARDGGKVVTSRRGVGRFVVRARGRPSHSGSRHGDGRSAIKEMAHQILALEAMTDADAGLSVNVGTIRGGTTPNTVPEHCEIQVDLRISTLPQAETAVARIRGLKAKDPDVKLAIEGDVTRPPFDPSPAGRALFERARAIAAPLGIDLQDVSTGGGSDGNFTAAMGVATLDGLGADGDGAHTGWEHLLIPSLVPRTRLLAALYEELA